MGVDGAQFSSLDRFEGVLLASSDPTANSELPVLRLLRLTAEGLAPRSGECEMKELVDVADVAVDEKGTPKECPKLGW